MLGESKQIASALNDHSDRFQQFSQNTARANAEIVQAMEDIAKGADQQAHRIGNKQSTHE